jgi:DnaJ homolog subfamily C member 17
MSEEENDPYELLGLTAEATDAEIKRAYRQRSLKVHPDRVCTFPSSTFTILTQTLQNPNNKDAG